jgi:hypothetical protein
MRPLLTSSFVLIQKKQKIKTRFSRSAKISHRSKHKKSGNMAFPNGKRFLVLFNASKFSIPSLLKSSQQMDFAINALMIFSKNKYRELLMTCSFVYKVI